MEVPFTLDNVLPYEMNVVSAKGHSYLIVEQLPWESNLATNMMDLQSQMKRNDIQTKLTTIINRMGRASAKAQHLVMPVTTGEKLLDSNHKLYVLRDMGTVKSRIIGILKIGMKKLFLSDGRQPAVQRDTYCVLDFYVCEQMQKMGFGYLLFQNMLQDLGIKAVEMAYDCPTSKCLSFLKKHYLLTYPIGQPNNYVIFLGFFGEPIGFMGSQLGTVPLLSDSEKYKKKKPQRFGKPRDDYWEHTERGTSNSPSAASCLKWDDKDTEIVEHSKLSDRKHAHELERSQPSNIDALIKETEKSFAGLLRSEQRARGDEAKTSEEKKLYSRYDDSSWNLFGVKSRYYSDDKKI